MGNIMGKLKYTYDEVKNYIENFDGYKLLDDTYINNSKKLKIRCPNNHIFEMNFGNFKQGKRCSICKGLKRYTYETIKYFIEIESNSGCKLISNNYTNYSQDLKIQCKCGKEFTTDFSHFLHQNKRQCNTCGNKLTGESKVYSYDYIKKKIENKGINLLTKFNQYKNIYQKLIGEVDGYKVVFLYNNLVNKNCMPEIFHKSNSHTIYNIKIWLTRNNKNFLIQSKTYNNAKEVLIWKCNICNRIWEANWDNILHGQECPICSSSKGEKKIDLLLQEKGFYYEHQYKFINCKNINELRFDFYIPSITLCIEYQGIQHYKPIDFAGRGKEWADEQFKEIQVRDQIKRDYCKINNINYLEIPYMDFDNIEQILEKELNNLKLKDVI